jgi:hypothetical protein
MGGQQADELLKFVTFQEALAGRRFPLELDEGHVMNLLFPLCQFEHPPQRSQTSIDSGVAHVLCLALPDKSAGKVSRQLGDRDATVGHYNLAVTI